MVVAAHSYGTILAAHLHRMPLLAARMAGTLFIDPIPFLLHHPCVAYSFIYRAPRTTNEWQVWYFASRDPDTARTLSRHFFWQENILWKEDIEGRRVTISLAGRDQIIGAQEVWKYLTGEEILGKWKKDKLEMLFFPDLDHAAVFDTTTRRKPLLEVVRRCVRDEVAV